MTNFLDEEEVTKESSNPFLVLKTENDLYVDDSNVKYSCLRVKRFATKNSEEWKIFEDKKLLLILDGAKFSNKEKEFLRTADGIRYILDGFKDGWRYVSNFKQNIKLKSLKEKE